MIYIQKKPTPPGLRNYKQRKGIAHSYKDFSEHADNRDAFEELRQSLVSEQHSICCYCQQAIAFKDAIGKLRMKTEHFEPKGGLHAVPHKQLDYGNLLASCLGNEDSENQDKHCDASKRSIPLKALPNPAAGKRRDFKVPFKYQVRVHSQEVFVLPANDDPVVKHEIDMVLNLNEQSLRSKRFSVWNSVFRLLNAKDGSKLNRHRIEQLLELYAPDSNKAEFKPFCGFIAQWLEEKYRKA